MSFCPNCGRKIEADTHFCPGCGRKVEEDAPQKSVRTQVYQGELHKCPSCGATVPSLTAICPECGHEFKSAQYASTMQEFTDKLREFDAAIAYAPQEKAGWSSWTTAGKVWWVILNIYTFCIPLVIYSFKNKGYKAGSKAQQKASYIETFVFPNERETILQALLFAQSQVSLYSTNDTSGDNSYWEKVWFNKATQLHKIAQIIIPNDQVAIQAYSDIVSMNRKFNKRHIIKYLIILGLIVALVTYAVLTRGDQM